MSAGRLPGRQAEAAALVARQPLADKNLVQVAAVDLHQAVVPSGLAASLGKRLLRVDDERPLDKSALYVGASSRPGARQLILGDAEVFVLLADPVGKAHIGFGRIDEVQPDEKTFAAALHEEAVAIVRLVGEVTARVQGRPCLVSAMAGQRGQQGEERNEGFLHGRSVRASKPMRKMGSVPI